MVKNLLILLLLPFFGCSQKQKFLLEDYSFLNTDNEVTKLHQGNDTLYELKCYINQPCQSEYTVHYKILSSNKTEDFIILKLERLDSILLTSNPLPVTRYSVLALKTNANKELGYLPLSSGLTRQQLDTIKIATLLLKEKFFFTYFSDTYLKEFSALKKVTTMDDVKEIIEATKSENFKMLVEKYSKTETQDMYASGLSAEILNRACIEKGFSPIGAGQIINTLMR